MSKVIIYNNDDGNVSVVIPTEKALLQHTIEEIAQKDVPHNKKYKIIDRDDLPAFDEFFNAWEVDESELTDGVGAESTEFNSGE